jgi:hypothetical protein
MHKPNSHTWHKIHMYINILQTLAAIRRFSLTTVLTTEPKSKLQNCSLQFINYTMILQKCWIKFAVGPHMLQL